MKLFSSSDRNARFKLLTQIEHFVEHLSSKIGKYVLLVWAFTDLIQLTYSPVCIRVSIVPGLFQFSSPGTFGLL